MNGSELTLLILRIGFLLLLWLFVFAIVYALRSDLFGQRVRKLQPDAGSSPFSNVPAGVPSTPGAGLATAGVMAAPSGAISASDSPLAGLAMPRTGQTATVTPGRGTAGGGATPTAATGAFGASSPNRPMATVLTATKLVITSGAKRGTELVLTNEPLTIGRSAESGLVIRDDYTSTHHARLLLWNNEWMIQDLDSTNGTFLDGKRVTVPTQVPLDAPIKIGTTTFELRR